MRIYNGQRIEKTSLNIVIECLKIFSFKRRSISTHLVKHTTERPNVGLGIIWFVSPNFWTRIVWSACLCIGKLIYLVLYFWYVKISQFICAVADEYVGTFNVPMENGLGMENSKTSYGLVGSFPHLILWNMSHWFSISLYFFLQISLI